MRTIQAGFLVGALLLSACSAGGGGIPTTPAAPGSTAPAHAGSLALRIRVPKLRGGGRSRAHYVSASTAAITVALTGLTTVSKTFALSPGVTTVTVPGLKPCPTSNTCYTASITTYDAVTGCPAACAIPAGAKALSANQGFAFSVSAGVANQVNATLGGIPVSVTVSPASAGWTGTQSAGFGVSKCFSTRSLEVVGLDADKNIILGAGAPVPSLVSNDTAHILVAAPAAASPNAFALTRPSLPVPKSVVQLTAAVTPAFGGGTNAPSVKVNVTFSSDICGVVSEFVDQNDANVGPTGITAATDGNLWFTEHNSALGQITTGGTITEFSTAQSGVTRPVGIVEGKDGKLWFGECTQNAIGTTSLTTGIPSAYSTGLTANAAPYQITSGPDGNLWFMEAGARKIGTITATPAGTITEFSTGLKPGTTYQGGIVTGPDKKLWFTQGCVGYIGNITTTGLVTEYTTGLSAQSNPYGITAGPDGNLWFTEKNAGSGTARIGKITTAGVITEYSDGLPASSSPGNITVGPDGNMWFTNNLTGAVSASSIGRVTTNGAITVFSTGIPAGADLRGITTGPDHNLWFTDFANNAVERMQ